VTLFFTAADHGSNKNRRTRRLISAVVLALSLVLSACAHQENTMTHLPANELDARIESGDAPTVIDVRSSWEYKKGHVPNAVHIPFWSIFWRTDELAVGKDEPIVVYCEHGPRAGIARFALHNAGFTNVLYLQGHMTHWRKQGLPIEIQSGE
jgi:rhodanese-related sulfurtransferase